MGKAGPGLAGKAREGEAGKVTLRQCSNALSLQTLWESTPASQYSVLFFPRKQKEFLSWQKKKSKQNQNKPLKEYRTHN